MATAALWRAAADAVLLLHVAVVLFVVGGLLHGAAITTVVLQSWFGITCPLTDLEWWLRAQAGQAMPAQGFIELWLHRLLFFSAPAWVFALAYSLFGLAVAAAWWRWPPRRD